MPFFSQYTNFAIDEVAKKCNVTITTGLSSREARERVHRNGPNEITIHRIAVTALLLRQFKSPFIYLLLAAGILAFTLGERIDAVLIALFVALNTGIGFYQEYKSAHTLQLLKQFVVRRSRVLRDGVEAVMPSRELVVGDVVIVEAGDVTPADIRIIDASDLAIDEAPLTGESVPVRKHAETLPSMVTELHRAANIVFSGTTVVTGRGVGIVIACGSGTMIGDIARLATETVHVSVFAKGIAKFSIVIMWVVLITLLFIIGANILIKGGDVDIPNLFIFGIALAVSVIPEALPVVTTFSLSRGALRLARHHVVVKRLASIEDLGSIDILCTDKTGTLTENSLAVTDTFATDSPGLIFSAALAAEHATERTRTSNNAFDMALMNKISETDRGRLSHFERTGELPFDPARRRNSVVVKNTQGHRLIVRGAPEAVFPLCTGGAKGGHSAAIAWAERAGVRGFRVIAVAERQFSNSENVRLEAEVDERHLTLVGCIAFSDPLKKSTMGAVAKARKLNVAVKILTGDSKEVAGYIGHQVGLIGELTEVMTGADFEALAPHDRYTAVSASNVFARVSPQQKHAIIQVLQQHHEVGFLGEGINDAPALKSANVGLVVAGAADIAQEAADIVLLKKSLDVIIDGIQEGREVFVNTVKYIKATLASNFGNFYAVAIASLFIDFLPMLPLQILLVNLLSDFPMIAIAADATDAGELKQPKHYDIKEIILVASILGLVSTVFDFIFFALFYQRGAGVLQTNWFIGSIATELAFLFSVRTRMPFFKAKAPATTLALLSLGALVVTVALPFIDAVRPWFKFSMPHYADLAVIAAVVVTYFVVTELVKNLYYYFMKSGVPNAMPQPKRLLEHRKV